MGIHYKRDLERDAVVYKTLLACAILKQEYGAQTFKSQLRRPFVKGVTSALLSRCRQLSRFHRGSNDMMRWRGRIRVLTHRPYDSWVDLWEPALSDVPPIRISAPRLIVHYNAQIAYMRQYSAENVLPMPEEPPAPSMGSMMADWNARRREEHVAELPLTKNMMGGVPQCWQP